MAFRQIAPPATHGSDENSTRRRSHIAGTRHPSQEGAFAVMFVPLVIVIIGIWGLAVEMGQIYNRKVDLYGISKAAALAAARELNGTPAGIVAAKNAASAAVANLRYNNYGGGTSFTWSDDALSFSTTSSRTGTWIPATGAGGSSTQAEGLFFARVDTDGLDSAIGTIHTFFIKILASNLAVAQVSDSAIAGRTSLKALPLAICAMSPDAATARPATSSSGGPTLSELVQYGFRRGISYDLMKLNPNGVTPARFAINPVSEPGKTSQGFSIPALGPFLCSGSMWVKELTGGTIRVSELPPTAPLASLSAALNTRFDAYANTPCAASGAPPDINIKSYTYDVPDVVKWMTPNTGTAAVATKTDRGRSEPVTDLPTPPASPGDYGPLWAYAKAARAPSPLNAPEPASGYATFTSADWPTLYPSGPTSSTYPTSPSAPYLASTAASGHYQSPGPTNKPLAVPFRRVLNVPLLSCTPAAPSGANAEATVVAIGKFFMTVPAKDNSLIAEFAGLLSPQSLPGRVELFP